MYLSTWSTVLDPNPGTKHINHEFEFASTKDLCIIRITHVTQLSIRYCNVLNRTISMIVYIHIDFLINVINVLIQSSSVKLYLYMKYLTFSPKVLFALCMEYVTTLLYNSYSLFNIFQDCFIHLFSNIIEISCEPFIKCTSLL